MEADWEVGVGGEAPVIDARWPGLVDLRVAPERAWRLPEAAELPALAGTLIRLNAAESPVWTSKCDLWPHLEPGEFDPDELDAPEESSAHALGCYIDLLPRIDEQWPTSATAIEWCNVVCGLIRRILLRCCRVDLIVRQAVFTSEQTGVGITAYMTACGPTPEEAGVVLAAALAALVDSILSASLPAKAASKLQ